MVYMSDYGRLPISPRQVDRIMRSPVASSEQSGSMGKWGGMGQYVKMGNAPLEARVTYFAIRDGIDRNGLGVATGLNDSEVKRGLGYLKKHGYIDYTEEEVER